MLLWSVSAPRRFTWYRREVRYQVYTLNFSWYCERLLTSTGVTRFSKSIWKSFKVEFKEIEESISQAKDEITEELALASEQEAHKFRGYLTAAVEDNNSFRIHQRAEIEESRNFRLQQRHALQQTEARQIQKILKAEGTLHAIKSTSA
jgi:uncharacterized protein YueI